MTHGLGYLPSPEDSRDYTFSKHFASSNPGSPVMIPTRPPLDQRDSSECVAHAAVRLVTTLADQYGIECPELSPHYLYQQCLLVAAGGVWDALPQLDIGTHPRTAMKRLASVGVPSVGACPLPDAGPERYARPTVSASLEAHDHRPVVGLFARCTSVDDISAALHQGHPVMIGLDIGEDWFDPPALLSKPSKRIGGHAVLVVGQDSLGDFLILNSWGPWHAPGLPAGYARLARSYVATSSDSWTARLQFQ